MNEKEAIDVLEDINQQTIAGSAESVQLVRIIQWLQMRADIIHAAENPGEEWRTQDLPYVYKLGKEMQRQAHIEVDSFIM